MIQTGSLEPIRAGSIRESQTLCKGRALSPDGRIQQPALFDCPSYQWIGTLPCP
jgi:hypothetical protein